MACHIPPFEKAKRNAITHPQSHRILKFHSFKPNKEKETALWLGQKLVFLTHLSIFQVEQYVYGPNLHETLIIYKVHASNQVSELGVLTRSSVEREELP